MRGVTEAMVASTYTTTKNSVGRTSGAPNFQLSPTFQLPSSTILMTHATAITKAMERSKVSLSGSNTRSEKTLKKRGTTIMAANQPASITLSQNTLSFVCMATHHLKYSLPEASAGLKTPR